MTTEATGAALEPISDAVLAAFIEDAERTIRMGVKFAFGTRADIALALGRELQRRRALSPAALGEGEAELAKLLEKVPEGPYFAGEDEAHDAPAHRGSGLAMVDAGRVSEWPAARLIEWPMAKAIAALLTHGPSLLTALTERERLREALTPSAETKAAYIGEFKMRLHRRDECGDEYHEDVTLSWTVIKEIMTAISNRAALSQAQDRSVKNG
jgi:hypothetical protein